MNCANHPDRERAAFCQHCGKPLCTECVRNVGNSLFCEPCLTARVSGTVPGAGYPYSGYSYPGAPYAGQPQPGPGSYPPAGSPPVPGEPNPGLAALLGFIPGVGAMYNEQYAKGIVHLIVFAVFVSLASDVNGIFGIFIAGWVCYMVAEAYHTARARRDGTPLPNPFGLNDLSERLGFGRAWPSGVPPTQPGATPTAGPNPMDPNVPPVNPYSPPYSYAPPYSAPPVSQWATPPDPTAYGVPPVPPVPQYPDPNLPYYRRIPAAAIWLIVLGAFFLLGNIPVLRVFHGRLLGPFLLIGGGVWLFVRRMTDTGPGLENDGTPYYQWRLQRAIRGAFWMILTGIIWLLDSLHILSWAHSWPLFLIGAGVMAFFKSSFSPGYGCGYAPPPATTAPPAAAVTSTELAPADTHTQPGNSGADASNQEGR